jgi:NADH-quinone oxidoreductase subunit A
VHKTEPTSGQTTVRRTDLARTNFLLANYLPILLFILVGIIVGALAISAGKVLAPNNPNEQKLSPYECGFEAFEDSRMKFDVRYYLVAILFIIFDLEIAFLFPWAIVLDEIGVFGFWAMMLFLGILVIGFIYEWKKGALEWE